MFKCNLFSLQLGSQRPCFPDGLIIFIRIFPDKPVTAKPAETRMGKGKGSVEKWVCVVKPGRILFEMQGISEEAAREALRLAAYKLPIKTKFVTRADPISGKEV